MLNLGANQKTGPSCGAKKCFIAAAAAGDITTTVNKGRQAGPMSGLLLLDVYGVATRLSVSIEKSLRLVGMIISLQNFDKVEKWGGSLPSTTIYGS